MRSVVTSVGAAVVVVGCARHAPVERATEARDGTAPSPAAPSGAAAVAGETSDAGDAGPRALAGFPAQLDLLEGGEQIGVVSVPLGAREPRPIMIALHGGSRKPAHACAEWRGVTESRDGAYPFVVCPRGWGGDERRLGWRSAADTSERIGRAVGATKQTFGAWIKDTPSMVLVGFSMGGSQVALVARREPKTYRRIVVGDSAHDPWPALSFSRAWVKGGGERAIFLCTTSGCEPSIRAAARNVARESAPARLNIAPTQVHGMSEAAVRSMRRDWAWLVEGAEGWEDYAPPEVADLGGRTETFDPK
jgi:dienelactone hydrolase